MNPEFKDCLKRQKIKENEKLRLVFLGIFILSGATQIHYSSTENSELIKEIVKVKYIDAHAARSVLAKFVSPKGKIQVIHDESRLIIEDFPEVMAKLLSIHRERPSHP